MNIKTIGLDIAKNVFQLHGVDVNGKTVLRKQLKRDKFCRVHLMHQLVRKTHPTDCHKRIVGPQVGLS